MSVHYKFKSALEYDTVTFDGLHISVKDVKNAIVLQKRIGKNTDFDLQVTNAQTKEVYEDEQALIPKNTSLLIARVPLVVQNKGKTWEGYGSDNVPSARSDEGGPAAKAVDLSSLDASEDDKIRAMMSQSTQDYDPSNYMKIRGANQVGQVPANYRCYKCHQGGHWIKDCPLGQGSEQIEIKKSTGIPRSFMVPVEGPQVQGAMMTPYGSYAVPALDHQTYTQKQTPAPAPMPVQKTDIPDDLLCSICSDLLTDAVMIPCCGNSFCDECIRSSLLESEDHECPDCQERDISPGTLIPNRFLRNSVTNFKSTTGYVKRHVYKPALLQNMQNSPNSESQTVKVEEKSTEEKSSLEEQKADVNEKLEKPVISEADSTEAQKTPNSDGANSKEVHDVAVKSLNNGSPSDLPPGVSPVRETTPERRPSNPSTRNDALPQDCSPRRVPAKFESSDNHAEERPGTPTVDEPASSLPPQNNGDAPFRPNAPYPSAPIPPVGISNSMPPVHHLSGPPPQIMNPAPAQYGPPNMQQPYGQPQGVMPQGPPSNYRYPPAPTGQPPPNYNMSGMYNMPPRPMYEQNRPPIQHGPPIQGPPNYPPNYPPRPPRGRDYPPARRTPPGVIDDPLEAFNRMLREKDERLKRAKKGRSYSRSSSRSYSRSPRRRSRSPIRDRRRSRSRSNSFVMNRSPHFRTRSRSFSPNHHRGSPYARERERERERDYSPRRRLPPSRYRASPPRSPNRYRYKDGPDRVERSRDYERDRDRMERDRHERDFDRPKRDVAQRGYSRERGAHKDYYYDNFDREKNAMRGNQHQQQQQHQHQQQPPPSNKWMPPSGRDGYYGPPQHEHSMPYHQMGPMNQQPMHQHPSQSHHQMPNRYPQQREPPYQNVYKGQQDISHPPMNQPMATGRRYEDVLPPGTEQPLPPGEENLPRYDAVAGGRYPEDVPVERMSSRDRERVRDLERTSKDRIVRTGSRDRHSSRDRNESRERNASPRDGRDSKHSEHQQQQQRSRKKSTDRHDSPHKKKRRDDSSPKKEDSDKRKEHSDDEKVKKSKDKKKKREKKDSEKKRKKEKKDKHKKEEKGKSKSEAKTEADNHEIKQPEVTSTNTEVNRPQTPISDAVEAAKFVVLSEDPPPSEKENMALHLTEEKNDLYGEGLQEGVDSSILNSYGVIEERRKTSISPVDINPPPKSIKSEDAAPAPKDEDVLELYTGELKTELDKEMLAPLPELSKWEMEEDLQTPQSVPESEDKNADKTKVTQDVVKRAENAIFAKAINAIRPIEIKKIDSSRAKLYAGEKDTTRADEEDAKIDAQQVNPVVTYEFERTLSHPEVAAPKEEPAKPVRLSVKERLGCKVDELDRIVRIDKPYDRNRSLSPLAKRSHEIVRQERDSGGEQRRRERDRRNYRGNEKDTRRDRERDERDSRRKDERAAERHRSDLSKEGRFRNRLGERVSGGGCTSASGSAGNDDKRKKESAMDERRSDKRRRSRSRSDDRRSDRRKREKKRAKPEKVAKPKSKKEDDAPAPSNNHKTSTTVAKSATHSAEKGVGASEVAASGPSGDRHQRKVIIDEDNFVPDYEADPEEQEGKSKEKKDDLGGSASAAAAAAAVGGSGGCDKKKGQKVSESKDSSTSSSSDSSSEDEKKRKKHKKHHRKRKRRDSSSSSSNSESSSSEDEKERKRRKHKKKSKKKKKSKHK